LSKKENAPDIKLCLFDKDLDDIINLVHLVCQSVTHHESVTTWNGFKNEPKKYKDDCYAKLLLENQLDELERFIIVLSLLQEVTPYLLNKIRLVGSKKNIALDSFGGGFLGDSTFLPTGDTIDFFLSNGNIGIRKNIMRILSPKGRLSKLNLIKMVKREPNAPFMSSVLTPTEELIEQVIFNKIYEPQYAQSFPAQKISSKLNWEDLVLSYNTHTGLEEIENWLACHRRMEKIPSIMKSIKRGYRALFHGPSGTGKTLTASLLGKKFNQDVYQIDLSMIQSKYIGETEKNLKNIFDVAENRDWILFFDEADALFGKRTQTSSSNDRYANQEVSYLLQRVEDYPGMVILASNLKSNMDKAFLRRFQSMVYFPSPSAEERLKLWKNTFNTELKIASDVDFKKIANEHEVTGATISNILRYCVLAVLRSGYQEIHKELILEGIKKERAKEGK